MLAPSVIVHLPAGCALTLERHRLAVPGQPEQDAVHLVVQDASGVRLAVLSVLSVPPGDASSIILSAAIVRDPAQSTFLPQA